MIPFLTSSVHGSCFYFECTSYLFYTWYSEFLINSLAVDYILLLYYRPGFSKLPVKGQIMNSLGFEGQSLSQSLNSATTLWCKINRKWVNHEWMSFLGLCNKVPQTGWLKTTELYYQFWRGEVQNQSVCRAVLPVKPAENPSLAILSSGVCCQLLAFLGL